MDSQYIDTIADIDTNGKVNCDIVDADIVDADIVDGEVDGIVDTPGVDIDNSEKINVNDSGGILYDILHVMDDIYVYGRSIIENNYFNFSSNEDFNLVYPNIYIGNYSVSTNLKILQGLGISHIISVLPTFNPPFPNDFKYLHIPAYDDETQNIYKFFSESCQFISNTLNENGKILIHCMVGRSRSITILLAFLIHIIKGNFNQQTINLYTTGDISNQIDFNRFTGKSNIINNNNFIIDGVNEFNGDKNNNVDGNGDKNNNVDGNGDSNGHGHGNRDMVNVDGNEKIITVKYKIPKLGNKYENYIIHKKETMIHEIDQIKSEYINIHKKGVDSEYIIIINEILKYIKKYRTIACPNQYFINQLVTFCKSS